MDALIYLPRASHRHSVTSLHPLKGGCDVCDALVSVTGVANVTFVTVVTPSPFEKEKGGDCG
jgi:hypothetical protein